MKALITGTNGTLGPVVRDTLKASGVEVIGWNRCALPPDDEDRGRAFIEEARPSFVLHTALGDPAWAESIARTCRSLGIGFVFTSSVSVYADRAHGPITVASDADGTSDYARYKLDCERRVLHAHPDAIIARLPWQIGRARGSNNMIEHLFRLVEHADPIVGEGAGVLRASTRWYPACAFLEDTSTVLCRLACEGAPGGTYLVDSNTRWSFFEIATALGGTYQLPWNVVAARDPVLDLRMVDDRIQIPSLAKRLLF